MKFLTQSYLLNLTLKEKRVGGQVKSLTVFTYLRIAVVIVFFIMGYVWVHLQVIKTAYEVAKLRDQRERLINQKQHLEVELMSLASFKQVGTRGSSNLGLVVPSKDRVIFVVSSTKTNSLVDSLADKANLFKATQPHREGELVKQGE